MSQNQTSGVYHHNDDRRKKLYFSSWFLVDQRWTSMFLVGIALFIGYLVWQKSDAFFLGAIGFMMPLLCAWRLFIPVHYELSEDGIVSWSAGQKRFIAWHDIRVYQVRRSGILLLPQRDRYVLEAFRGFFLPVPAPLMTEVLYRFRVFVDKIEE